MRLQKLEKVEEYFLKKIYVESEFIDPVDDILERSQQSAKNVSIAFIVTEKDEVVSFFTVESSNPNVTGKGTEKGIYWLESFFITKHYLGKGYSKAVVMGILQELPTHLPTINSLNLTVNSRNEVAQRVYKKCGFIDTHKIYTGGPAGPQCLYQYAMVDTTAMSIKTDLQPNSPS